MVILGWRWLAASVTSILFRFLTIVEYLVTLPFCFGLFLEWREEDGRIIGASAELHLMRTVFATLGNFVVLLLVLFSVMPTHACLYMYILLYSLAVLVNLKVIHKIFGNVISRYCKQGMEVSLVSYPGVLGCDWHLLS